MHASEHFQVGKTAADDWFDLILDNDTKVFVDPFLIFKEKDGFWKDCHEVLVSYFEQCFQLIASANRNQQSPAFKKALALLEFHEPKETCLGYTSQGTSGAGGGTGYAQTIAAAMQAAINRGLQNVRHFEELGILNEGIGPDRISDIACNVLKPQFVEYTQGIARRHGITLTNHMVHPGAFDEARGYWVPASVELPTNPFNEGPLLFVPSRFLNDLPTLNADDWWEAYEARRLRDDMNYELMGKVGKKKIIEIARQHAEDVRSWTQEKEAGRPIPYDLARDPLGVYVWDASTASYVQRHPVTFPAVSSSSEFFALIEKIVEQFRLFIEDDRGWTLLWDDRKEKREEAAQLLFKGIAKHYCKANGIVIDREVELGRGPVDFKFSNGYSHRALMEVKMLHNGKFWNGLERQLPTYMTSDECRDGWFLVIQTRDSKSAQKRLANLPARVRATSTSLGLSLRYAVVDALPKLSASKQ